MKAIQFSVAIIGAGLAGMSCARHLQSDACKVTLFDSARISPGGAGLDIRQGKTVCDIWHEDGWRVASLEAGAHAYDYDILILALPGPYAAALLAPLLPATAMEVAAMERKDEGCIWLPAVRAGVCGDWLHGGQEGDAWLSGRALAARVRSQCEADQNSVEAVSANVRGAPSTR
jgi:predicted NAD/FAD-dependent oxidoreductase